ncbi:aspartyl-tRNA(Asn)/glutamyl-tRNA(Gln) amidotransferase subunit A [Catalinimonas alkaloidigena]|uniref:Glutamyl-tRNA(Gln) amidotransferase subunit A n=1 Tax=Catalinimonas alkaloidigena TaxID=1075417 RepID=A0A1G9DVI6_9BACT|nr:Asp-tRNA(Asn)/Glu-tRNA(Gln) amidotransferase subunit GatA [Catalinimonas alkaloidigena]SDK67875.1 aspartyl-tRNA(Asn)/glutamyl-tRNA(Gln) amidotransferase subunit A [Catalinimonas alkaloidigena]
MTQSIRQIQAALYEGKSDCLSLVETCINNIQANSKLGAFLEVYEDEARTRAREIDQKIASGTAGKLAGVVVGIKDVLCYRNHHLQAASRILDGFVSQFTATAVQRLLDEDAIIIGRQNCDEFAMGSSSENSAFGPVLNGADLSRVPGGSSGGSAVAVQMDMCHVSLGTDTGGSVRQPGAFCGVIGMKPTYSRISRWGLASYASSFDSIGILSKHLDDVATVLQVIAGPDEYDSTASQHAVEPYVDYLEHPLKPCKVAVLREGLEHPSVAPEIRQALRQQIDFLENAGHSVEIIDFPLLEYILPTYYILTTAEASANLARYDGVRYGYRSPDSDTLAALYKKSRSQGFGEEVQRRILLGTFVLSAGYYDAYYTKAQRVRRLIKEATEQMLTDHDFMLLPTTPTTAFRLNENTDDPLAMYLADLFTVQASVAGLPAISLPCGTDQEGLPIGIQLMANRFKEGELLAFSNYLLNKKLTVA